VVAQTAFRTRQLQQPGGVAAIERFLGNLAGRQVVIELIETHQEGV
jgi:hypothetical protein